MARNGRKFFSGGRKTRHSRGKGKNMRHGMARAPDRESAKAAAAGEAAAAFFRHFHTASSRISSHRASSSNKRPGTIRNILRAESMRKIPGVSSAPSS